VLGKQKASWGGLAKGRQNQGGDHVVKHKMKGGRNRNGNFGEGGGGESTEFII